MREPLSVLQARPAAAPCVALRLPGLRLLPALLLIRDVQLIMLVSCDSVIARLFTAKEKILTFSLLTGSGKTWVQQVTSIFNDPVKSVSVFMQPSRALQQNISTASDGVDYMLPTYNPDTPADARAKILSALREGTVNAIATTPEMVLAAHVPGFTAVTLDCPACTFRNCWKTNCRATSREESQEDTSGRSAPLF